MKSIKIMIKYLFLFQLLLGQIDYNSQIQTIFNESCTNCHGNSGGLKLESYQDLMDGGQSGDQIIPNNHASSNLWQRINSGEMPPGNNDLSSEEINLIAQWIDEGALEYATAGCTDSEAYNCDGSLADEYVNDIGGILYDYSCDGSTDAGTESCADNEVCTGFYNPSATSDDGSCRYYQAPQSSDVDFTVQENGIYLDWSSFIPPQNAVLQSYHIQRCLENCTWVTGFNPGNINTDTSVLDEFAYEEGVEIKYAIAVKYENNPYWGWAIGASYITPGSSCTYISDLPETATVASGDNCFNNADLVALNDLISANNLTAESSVHVGNQTWNNGRLTSLTAYYEPNGTSGVQTQMTVIPESFGNLTSLGLLYLEWNRLTSLPESFSNLTSLISLTVNNNLLTGLPSNIGNLTNLYFLDLGYNQINELPDSICNLSNLQYLYLFNNFLDSIPECICNINLNWSGFDGGSYPYFGIGCNSLCEDVPSCVENSTNFELTLDQFYYSIPLDCPQDCEEECSLGDLNGDGGYNVLDIVTLANCILSGSCNSLSNSCAADMNGDGGYNVLDIVTLANCILSGSCDS